MPVISGVTGEVLTTERAGSAGYWVDQARQPVRFADVVGWLAGQGVGVFTELGPDGALSALGPGCLPGGSDAVWVPALRPGRDEPATALLAAGELFVRGVGVDWAGLLGGEGGRRVDVPTQAFVRQRFWPQPGVAGAGDVAGAGLEVAGHPLLAAAVELADDAGVVLTGRLSVQAQPWLGDHVVLGSVVLPGTAFVEMAAWAGRQAGCDLVDELTLEAPLVLPDQGAVRLQVRVGRRSRWAPRGQRALSG